MRDNDVIYQRTEIGEDTHKLVQLLLRLAKLKQEKAKLKLVKIIDKENQKFKKKWNKDGVDFITKVFSK